MTFADNENPSRAIFTSPTATLGTIGTPLREDTGPQVLTSTITEPRLSKLLPPRETTDSKSFYNFVRIMKKDPTIALVRGLSIVPALASEWSVTATPDAPDTAKAFIAEQMLHWQDYLLRSSLLGVLDYGWQSYEKVFKVKPSRAFGGDAITISKFKGLMPDHTDILVDPRTGAFIGLENRPNFASGGFVDTQSVVGNWITLERNESLLITVEFEGTNWYGESAMENVIIPYKDGVVANETAKRYDTKIAGSTWVLMYPAGSTLLNGTDTPNSEIAQTILSTLKASGSLAIPNNVKDAIQDLNTGATVPANEPAWSIELISSDGNQQSGFVDRLKYLDNLKVRGLGFPERSILEGTYGTKAESEVQGDFAISNVELRHKSVLTQLNKHAVNQLLRLNYGPEFENTVSLTAVPITDSSRDYLRKMYSQILSQPEGLKALSKSLDIRAISDTLNIPLGSSVEDIDIEFEDATRLQVPDNVVEPIEDVLSPEVVEQNSVDSLSHLLKAL